MHDVMSWLEGSPLGLFMRHSGLWTYALVNLSHVLGIATLFGPILILDLRLLGCWRRVPLSSVSAVVVPIATAGFLLAALTGLGLVATKATEYVGNPFFYAKFPAILLGLVNVAALQFSPAWRAHRERALSAQENLRLAVAGGVSLASWTTAVVMGRMIAYW